MTRIRFTPQADRDFIEIYQYIAGDNIDAADQHHKRLRRRCLDLVDQPRSGTKRDEVKPGLRSVTEGDYVIFYRIEGRDNIAVLRVVHAKRDLAKLTFAES
ncbi:MAG: type II toxin-antitoxin system RelE/ParE family toxin [Cyanobacteria bacterium HKST-UBA02]|nr:type II toxin-antitoxin system RelE/ParE family toxin [Cyanobacteria bacterium HKST-UBA02]